MFKKLNTSSECECECNFTCRYCLDNAKPYFFTPSKTNMKNQTLKLTINIRPIKRAKLRRHSRPTSYAFADRKHLKPLGILNFAR